MFTEWNGLLVVGLLLVLGLYAGHLTRRIRLPAILGYMTLGVVLGPHVLGVASSQFVTDLGFVIDVGLALVAFTIGAELKFSLFKRLGRSLAIILCTETLLTFLVVTGVIGWVLSDWPVALLLGAIASASAPAGTVAVIQELQAKGPLTNTLFAVIGLDDALSVVIYGFALVIAKVLLLQENGAEMETSIAMQVAAPLLEIGGSIGIGVLSGWCYVQLARRARKFSDLLVLTIGWIVLTTGLCEWLHLSLILTNMAVGMYLVNSKKEGLLRRVREMLSGVMPLTFVLFFALAGAHLDLYSLTGAGVVALLYFISRIAGKAGGAWVGCVVGKADALIRNNLGPAILSQAGLAVGLALIVFTELSSLVHAPRAIEVGQVVLTTITATTLLFEIIGPILVRRSLMRAGETNE